MELNQFEEVVFQLLKHMGEDPEREGLRDTPKRVARMWSQVNTRTEFEFTTFDAEGMDSMVVQTDIPFYSFCEHHMLPFMGTAAVGYIPNGKICGLSKLTRAVQFCSKGLQNQERVTQAIAKMICAALNPLGLGVVIRARHLCMEIRGVCVPNVYTTTSELVGVLRDEASARAEFLSLAMEE